VVISVAHPPRESVVVVSMKRPRLRAGRKHGAARPRPAAASAVTVAKAAQKTGKRPAVSFNREGPDNASRPKRIGWVPGVLLHKRAGGGFSAGFQERRL